MTPGADMLFDGTIRVKVVRALEDGRVIVSVGGGTMLVQGVALTPFEE